MNIKEAIADVVDGQDLTRDQMYDVFPSANVWWC